MPIIKKVAEVAGVSVGTVSHVTTCSVNVSEPLRLKVQPAIWRLNYHPNHVARSLKTSRTNTLGIIVSDLTIPFFPAYDIKSRAAEILLHRINGAAQERSFRR